MRAVTFDVAVPRYLLTRALGGLTDAFSLGGLSGVHLAEIADPELPAPDWVALDVVACGICGTDLSNLLFASAPTLEPFASFPAVLGHEIVARVRAYGDAVRDLEVGQRVSVDPMIGCRVRGYGDDDLDSACRRGAVAQCVRSGETGRLNVGGTALGPGTIIGFQRQLPGGWSERMIAHRSQVVPIPDGIDDRRAVLVEPLSIATHGVLGAGVIEGGTALADASLAAGPILVIGSGAIALGTVWSLRALGYRGEIVVQAKRPHERDCALALGASSTVAPGSEARSALFATGARAYEPVIGPEVYAGGGFVLIFDCVGTRSSLQQALSYAAPRGRVVMLGCASRVSRLDLTFVWFRELELRGSSGYGPERWRGRQLHTHAVVHQLLAEHEAPVADLITHAFTLDGYRQALRTAVDHRATGAIKVVFSNTPERFRPAAREGRA